MLNVEKIYVVHYTRLIERKYKLDAFFRQHKIKADYIFEYDKEALNESIINNYYDKNIETYNKKIIEAYKDKFVPFRQLSNSEISCTIKHYTAIKKISDECKDYGLVLEDDVEFCDDFINLFNEFLQKTPNDWDVIFMGNCCNLGINKSLKNINEIAFLKEHPASKCADSFLIKSDLAKKMSNTMKPFSTISDWEYSYQFYLHGAKVYWWEPSLTRQGSESGTFKSSLR